MQLYLQIILILVIILLFIYVMYRLLKSSKKVEINTDEETFENLPSVISELDIQELMFAEV